MGNAIQRINRYPVNNAIGFLNTHPLVSDLSGCIKCYPAFEHLGPDVFRRNIIIVVYKYNDLKLELRSSMALHVHLAYNCYNIP